jgi:hypothetical protein
MKPLSLSTISFFTKLMNAYNPFIYSLERHGPYIQLRSDDDIDLYIYNMALYTVIILPNINKKIANDEEIMLDEIVLVMYRIYSISNYVKIYLTRNTNKKRRGGGEIIQFTTKGDTKSNSILKKR